MRFTTALALALVACGGSEVDSRYGDQVLEKGKVEIEEMEGLRRDLAGTLSVDGSGSSWDVRVSTSAGSEEISIFSPAQSDLSVLDGRDALVTLIEHPLTDELGVVITDAADGSLLYLFEPVEVSDLTDLALDETFAAWGSDLGTETIDLITLHLSSVQFSDDAGPVEGLPGEPVALTLGGQGYRAVLIAAYDVETDPAAPSPNCESTTSLLSYEVVLADDPDLTVLTRPESASVAVGGCDTF